MRLKKTIVGVEVLRKIACQGYRIFTLERFRELSKEQGIKEGYVLGVVHLLIANKWITPIKKGIYAFTLESGMSEPPHDFEIAQAISQCSAISHWTAMHYHQITQQTPNTIFSITTKKFTIPKRFKGNFCFKVVQSDRFFGIQKIWIGNAKIQITDLEKTLLDGLSNPELCGGFAEVYNAFVLAIDRLRLERIISYALRSDLVTAKRLGWILDKLGLSRANLKNLKRCRMKGFGKLDPTGPSKGTYDHYWQLLLNA